MNVEYMKVKDCVYVTEDDGLTHTRRNVEDIEKILIHENRYERLGKMIKDYNNSLDWMCLLLSSLKNFNRKVLFFTGVSGLIACLPLSAGILFSVKIMMILVSIICGSLFVFGVSQVKGISKDIDGLENEIICAENKRIQIRNELVNMKRKSSCIVGKQVDDRNVKLEKGNCLEEKPFFIELDDKDYLENLYDDLNEAYELGFNKKNKVKVLKK